MASLDLSALKASAGELGRRYAELRDERLSVDMTRGKPCSEQLGSSNG